MYAARVTAAVVTVMALLVLVSATAAVAGGPRGNALGAAPDPPIIGAWYRGMGDDGPDWTANGEVRVRTEASYTELLSSIDGSPWELLTTYDAAGSYTFWDRLAVTTSEQWVSYMAVAYSGNGRKAVESPTVTVTIPPYPIFTDVVEVGTREHDPLVDVWWMYDGPAPPYVDVIRAGDLGFDMWRLPGTTTAISQFVFENGVCMTYAVRAVYPGQRIQSQPPTGSVCMP